jgi:hypothetical protein
MRNILHVAVLGVVVHVELVLATIFLFGIVALAYVI